MIRKLLKSGHLVLFVMLGYFASAQNIKLISSNPIEVPKENVALMGTPQIQASDYKVFQMDILSLKNQLVGTMHREIEKSGFVAQLPLPHPDGTIHLYNSKQNSTMHPDLASKFEGIKSYDAHGVDNAAFVKWDITPHGLHAMIMIPGESTIFIDPVIKGNTDYYIVYRKKDFISGKTMDCSFDTDALKLKKKGDPTSGTVKTFGTCELRTYRLALSATGEYSAFHGGTVALAQAAQVTSMNRVNGVYEKDMAITMVIIANNNLIVYTNAGSDPFTNGNPGTMIGQNQTNTNTVIGSANYDIGHVFGTNSGGLAGLGVVCSNNQKARGVTGSGSPVGDPFDIDYVAHEMGHQFGCNHSFNNSCGGNRNNATAVEPGSGSTIMAYAGICAPNVQSNSDDHFSGISLEEMGIEIMSGGHQCEVITPLANSAPVLVSTNGNVTVPANTPFALTAVVTDVDNDPITYNWEQMDVEISTQSPVATSTGGPNFRSDPSSLSPTRYFPNLVDLAAGGPFTWEVIPSVTRTMNFRVSVRDNASGAGGCNDHGDVTITTDAGSGPFVVNYPSATGIVWTGVTSETVTWSVANTDVAPVSCALVDILLSTDGGLTYPTVLASGVANDGSQVITVPNVATTTARVMVICSTGTFFDISDNNFEITMATFDYTLSATPSSVNICQPNDATFTVNIGSVGGYTDPVTLSVSGVPAGATSNFSTNPVTPIGTSTLTISNTGAAAPGVYVLTISGVSTTGTKLTTVTLSIASGTPTPVAQISPVDGAAGVGVPTTFTWTTAPEIGVTYDIDIASDPGFSGIVDQASGLSTPTYATALLNTSTTYYWRVRAITGCGTSVWSATFSFTTSSCVTYPSTDVGQIISAATTTSTITITDAGILSYVSIPLMDLTHAYVGDISATLTSPLGTTVQLFDGPGIPASQYGCSGKDILASFDDAAALTSADFENMCNPAIPTISGDFQTIDLLSLFNGESITGVWTLTILDSYVTADDGVINDWSLKLCVLPPACVSPDLPTLAGVISICPGDATTLSVSSGNLNDATDWQWYSGACGGTPVGSGTSINVSPGASISYFVRGEGGCVTPGACTQIVITVNPTYNISESVSICQGEPYNFPDGTSGTTAQIYTSSLTTAAGCDSIIVTTLSVDPIYNTSESVTICQGDPYNFPDGTPGTTTQVYTSSLTTVAGCDSIITTSLLVNPTYNTAQSATICQGDTYTFPDGTAGTTTQVYTSMLNTAAGCDSIIVTSLSVVNAYNSTESAAICQGDSYTFPDGTTATTAQVYTSTLVSTGGCDSIIVTILSVDPIYNTSETVTICQGDPYSFPDGTAGTTTQVYTSSLTTAAGCDSIIVTTLSVDPIYNTSETVTICQGDPYNFPDGTAGTTTQVYTSMLATAAGCDSIIITSLLVNPTYTTSASATICQGDTYTFPDGTAGTTTQIYTSALTTAAGCDSIIVTTLSVVNAYNSTESAAICQGGSYTFPDGTTGTTSQVYTSTLVSTGGCDSIIVTTLTVDPIYNTSETVTICQGDAYNFPDGTAGTTTQVYTSSLTTAAGCDSIIITSLLVNPTYSTSETAVICQGASYTFPDGTVGTTTQVYTSALTTTDGCDSIIVTSLLVNPTYSTSETAVICQGTSYTFPDGTVGTTTQVYTSLLNTTAGCDSIIVTSLQVTPAFNTSETVTICQGSSYTFPDGTVGTTTQVYTSLLTTAAGCDSTIITALTVLSPVVVTESVTICGGLSYMFPDGTIGTTTQAYTSVLTGSNGCDSTIVTALTVNPIYSISENVTICEGGVYTFPDGTTGTTPQVNTSALLSAAGCDSIIVTTLEVQTIDATVTQNGSTLTVAQTGATYQWVDCNMGNAPIPGETNQSFTPTDMIGNYAVIVTIGDCSSMSLCMIVDLLDVENEETEFVSIYPNPAFDFVTVEWNGEVDKIEITDAKGKLLNVIDHFNGNSFKLELVDYSVGVYFIHIHSEHGRTVHDIMKQ